MDSIAIVVPVRNRENLVARTLDSIAQQTYRPLRLIVVDNGSTDATLVEVEKWATVNRTDDFKVDIYCESTPGAAAARNAGLDKVQENWTMFFDSDDIMLPTHVEEAMKCVNENSDCDLVAWNAEINFLDGKKAIKQFVPYDMIFHGVMLGCMATCMYMARTELYRKVGGWNSSVMVWNDIELGVRLLSEISNSEHKDSPLGSRQRQGPKMMKINGKPSIVVMSQERSISGIDYHSKGREREYAIDCIERNLDAGNRWIANLKRAVLAGLYEKEGKAQMADSLMDKISDTSAFHRMLYRFVRRYTKSGMRGAARLVRPFF